MRRAIIRSGGGLALVAAATVLGLTGIGFFLWSAYLYARTFTEPAMAAFLTGVLSLFLTLSLLWIAIRLNR